MAAIETRKLKNARWQLAFDQVVRAQNLEATIHVVQRIPVDEISKSAKIIPSPSLHAEATV